MDPAESIRPRAAEQGQARYLFVVARGLAPDALEGLPGFEEKPVEVVEHRGLQAVVGTVDLAEFGEEALRDNLEDLAWLEAVARRHNDVVFAAASNATVAPMRLVTILADDDSVRARIDELHEPLSEALDRVEGCREWSVKAYVAPATAPTEESTSRTASGADYLRRKREQAERRRAVTHDMGQLADDLHDSLAARAVASRRLPAQDPRLTGRSETMVLNGAYLVSDADGDGFRTLVARLGEQNEGAILEVEGPWPPYSFATLDQA